MKKIIKILCIFVFSIFNFSVFAWADYALSVAKQKELDAKVLELLKSNNLEELEEYINSIPDCVYSEDGQVPDICTFDRIDGKDFTTHALQSGFRWEHKNFTAITPDAALYDAFKTIYSISYHKNYRTLDIDTYRDFYNRYKGTWLNDRVEKTLVRMWQKGDFLTKYNNSFSCMTGETIYTTIYISHMLKFSSIYKYSSPEITFATTVVNAGRGRLHSILNEMKRKSNETNTNWLLNIVVSSWFDSLIASEQWDRTEQNYYKGKKQQRMYDMFNEEGWDMFANAGLTPTDWQKHTVTLYVKACRRVIGDEKKCAAFEEGAAKYGFYIPPEVIEKEIAEETEKQLTATLERKTGYFDKGYLFFK